MRIAFVHSGAYYGSTERSYLQPLLEGLDPAEFETWLVSPDEPALMPLHALAGGSVVPKLPAGAGALRWIGAYRRALRRIGPALVHVVDVDAPALIAARLAGVRRVVVTHHTPELRARDSFVGRAVRRAGWSTRPHVVFTSEFDRETGLRLEPIRPERAHVIALPIDLERFDPARVRTGLRGEAGLDSARIVGSVGLLKPQKGYDVLIAAAETVLREEPAVRFLVVGEGALRAELEDEARRRGLEGRFVFLGHREDVPDLVAGFDVFALSSTFEGMCLAVGEALALAKPVVATSVGGVRQSVVDGQTGLLVPPSDPDALAGGILRLLRDPDEARRLGIAGRERVLRLYPPGRMVSETAGLYRRLLGTS
jgi:glycosyltransferase involved in cell wall biosynthesis